MSEGPVRVLLVEDNMGDACLLRETLKDVPSTKYLVDRVDRLSVARERLAATSADVVLLDLSVPDGQGVQTVEDIHGAAPHVPIVVLTGLDDELVAARAVREGAQDYLIKGETSRRELERSISYAIERSRSRNAERIRALEMEALFNISAILGRPGGFEEKAAPVVQELARVSEADWVTLRLPDEERKGLRLVAAGGPRIPEMSLAPLVPYSEGMLAPAAKTGHRCPSGNGASSPNALPAPADGPSNGPALALPIKAVDGCIGAVFFGPHQQGHFSPDHVKLLAGIVDRLGAPIENARLNQALRASMEERAVTNEVARIIGSTLDIGQVYEKFAAEVKKLVDFDRVSLSVFDQDTGTFVPQHQSGIQVAGREANCVVPIEGTVAEMVLQTGRPAVWDDIRENNFVGESARTRAGLRSRAIVPLVAKGSVVGTLSLHSCRTGAYGQREQAVLERLADQIAPAVDNARLHSRLRDSTEEKAVVDEVARIITSTLDIDQVYERFAAEVKKLLDFDQLGINLIDRAAGTFTPAYRFGVQSEGRAIGAAVPLKGTLTERMLQTGRPVLRENIRKGAEFSGDPARLRAGLLSGLAVPLFSKGRVTGALHVLSRRTGAYGHRERDLLERLATQIAPAIENARLYQQAREAEAELRKLFQAVEQSPVSVTITDTAGIVQYVNPRFTRVTGYNFDEALGRTLTFLKPEDTPEDVYRTMWDAVSRGDEWKGELLNRKRNGELYWSSASVSPVRNPVGAITNILAVEEDITERRRSEQELKRQHQVNARLHHEVTVKRELERRMHNLISLVSHELRTPMTGIMGFAELLLNRETSEATQQQWLDWIHRSSKRLTAIVDALLDVSRIQSGKLKVTLEPLELRSVIEEQLGALRSTTEKHRIVNAIPEDIPPVTADRDKLAQVLANLLDNAIKYSPQGGDITVSAFNAPEKRQAVVAVKDQGIGIAARHQRDLFSTFHRIHRPETETIRGTGLGLHIVKELMELMRGRVWVESELDQGSEFFISLPVNSSDTGSPSRHRGKYEKDGPGRRRRRTGPSAGGSHPGQR